MKQVLVFLLSSFILFSCASATQTVSQTETVKVYATSAAQPWLTKLYACAENIPVGLNFSADKPDIYLRLGESEMIASPAYKIDEEEILIVTNRQSVAQNLSLADAQTLFAQGNHSGSAQVWVYSSDADLQIVFDQLVMKGRSVTSSARVAVSAQNMFDILNSESNAVGILPRHSIKGNVREIYSVGKAPVLAIVKEEPHGTVAKLIACLQSN